MCFGTSCEHDDMDRRAFLNEGTASLTSLAALGARGPAAQAQEK
jgi:hypothetical protein